MPIDATWDQLYHTVARDVCKESFKDFVREFWSEIVMEPLVWNWHMEVICDEMQAICEPVFHNEPRKHDLIINVPPGSSKSLICSIFFPAWVWTKHPSARFICVSYSSSLSLFLSTRCRDLVKSEKYKTYFPMVLIRKEQDQKQYFQLTMKGDRFATSVGGTVTGYHAHFLLVDDPVNPQEALSQTQLRTNNNWIENTLLSRKVDKTICPMAMIMQRLHEDDPTGFFLSKKGHTIKHICFPAELTEDVKPKSFRDKYVDGLLDPTRMPKMTLEEIRLNGAYTYAGQYLQRPAPIGDGFFKPDKINIVPVAPAKLRTFVRYWDKAGTAGGGCYTAGVQMARTMDDKFIILDVVRGQWAVEKRERIIKHVAASDDDKTTIHIEQEPGSGGLESAQATIKNLAGYRVYADAPKGDKARRAEPFAVQVNNGNVLMVKADWNAEFIRELQNFPVGKYKDQVDAASGAFSKLSRMKKAGTW